MDEMKKENMAHGSHKTCETCGSCAYCMHQGYSGFGHRYFVLRWLLGLLILAIVFFVGVKVGELRGFLGNYGSGGFGMKHMRSGFYPQPMMYRTTGQWGSATPFTGMMGNPSSTPPTLSK